MLQFVAIEKNQRAGIRREAELLHFSSGLLGM